MLQLAAMQPAASIIIVSYNCAEDIGQCLTALQQLQTSFPYTITVVDNASSDGTPELIRARFPDVQVLAETENRGFAGGVNQGVRSTTGDYVALLNPDAVAGPAWLAQLIDGFADPEVGVVGSKVLGPDGRLQSIGSTIATPLMLPAYRGEGEIDAGQYDDVADVWSVHGAAMAFRRRLWEEVGGFDAGYYPAYLEESDFCQQVRRAGYRVVTAPTARVQHREASTTGKHSAQFYYYFLRNRLRFAAKWLTGAELWDGFRLAEHHRLTTAPLLDRRVAQLVYREGVPSLAPPSAEQRAAILATGQALREGRLPDDGIASLQAFAEEAEEHSVHREVLFHSRLPLIAQLRTAWNSVATRWYVRPGFDQQTRYNLAVSRALRKMLERTTADAAAQALDIALLIWLQQTIPNTQGE